MLDRIQAVLEEEQKLLDWLKENGAVHQEILDMTATMLVALRAGGRILSCGNGGSMCDAMHFAEELTGRFSSPRPAISAHAICDPSHISCTANDYGFEEIFSRGVEAWGRKGDVLLAFSTSGNSLNVIRAAEKAHESGMKVCGLLGRDGGKLLPLCDHSIVVPSPSPSRVQEIHIKLVHMMIELIETGLMDEGLSGR